MAGEVHHPSLDDLSDAFDSYKRYRSLSNRPSSPTQAKSRSSKAAPAPTTDRAPVLADTYSVGVLSKRVLVEVLGRYSKLDPIKNFPEVSRVRSPRPAMTHVHAARRRLGPENVAALVADYEGGQPTTALMRTYALGKGTVLQLLRDAGVQIRKPGPRPK